LQTTVSGKADASSVYTKTETDGLLNAKANASDVYTKTEADGLLSAKANASDLATVATSGKGSDLSDWADKQDALTAGSGISLSGSTISVSGITNSNIADDAAIALTKLATTDLSQYDNSTSGFITKDVSDLTNYKVKDTGDGLTNTSGTVSVNAGAGLTFDSGALTLDVDGTTIEIDGTNGLQIVAGGVGETQLADDAVTSAKIVDGTIATDDLADSSVTSAKIVDGTIATDDLADSSVTSAKIVDGTIATDDLADSSVTSAKIVDGTIVADDLAADSVTTAKIVDGNVTTDKIADGAVTSDKLAAAVANNLLDAATTSDGLKITAGNDTTPADIALQFATNSGLQEVAGEGLAIQLADTTSSKSGLQLDANGLSIKAGDTIQVTNEGYLNIKYKSTQFEANATDGLKILAGAIDTNELADDAVTSDKIADGAVTLDKLGSDVATATATVDSTQLITSGGVYSLVNVTGTNNYIANGTDVAGNLISLDAAVKSNADDIAQNASDIADIQTAITVTADGNYITAANDVKNNLVALDTAIGSMADFATQNYAQSTTSVAANLTALDTQVKANADKNDVQDTGLGNIVTALNGGTYTAADGSISGGDTLSTDFTATNLTAAANELLTDITVGSDGKFITAGADVAGNLTALDTAIGDLSGFGSQKYAKDTTNVAANLTALDTAIGDMSGFGDQNYATDTTNVAANLTALDTQVKTNADAIGDIGDLVNSNYASDAESLTDSVMALDSNLNRVEGRVDALDRRVHKMHHEMKSGFASLAALSGLVPNARSAGDTQISVGTGYYRGTTGFALGAFHHLNDSVLLNAGASYAGNGSAIFKGGVTFGF